MIKAAAQKFFVAAFLLLAVPAHATSAEVGFSPSGGAQQLVISAIDSAKSTIRLVAYSFTSTPIAKALLQAHQRGVDVQIVLDKSNATARYSAATFLANQGVPVRIDYRYAIMHDKFIVIDGHTIETGSFNFTAGATFRNAENIIVLHDAPQIAAVYAREWPRLCDEAEPLPPRY